MMAIFWYRAFGLDITSELKLPELRCAMETATAPDVRIELGQVPGDFKESAVEFERGLFRLCIPSVGRFEVTGGKRIIVEPARPELSSEIRAYLLGSALGALFHQRGVLCLHASVVAAGDRAIAIIGESGAGKSTLALKLADAGYTFLCDDLCAVDFDESGTPITWPGLRRSKVWSTTLAVTGRASTGLERVEAKGEKYHLPIEHLAPDQPHRLTAVFVLRKSVNGVNHLKEMAGKAAIMPLISNTFRGSMISLGGDPAAHFRSCVQLAERCSIYEMKRRWELAALDETIRSMEPMLTVGGGPDGPAGVF